MKARRKPARPKTRPAIVAAQVDPTFTGGIRQRFASAMAKRFAEFKRDLVSLVVVQDAFGLRKAPAFSLNALTANSWRYLPDPEKIRQFQAWLKQKYAGKGIADADLVRQYILEGFRKGAGRSFDDVRRPQKDGPDKAERWTASKEEFLRSSFAQPIAVERLQILAGRTFDELQNVTDDMSNRLSRALTDGLVQGQGPRELARDLAAQVDISKKRAELIARTETIRAHADGQLLSLENLGVEELGVMVEWTTARKGVCPLCSAMAGTTLKIQEAKGMIPRHPNCVVGESVIEAGDAIALMETHYTGEIIEFVTERGRRCSVTPNHMLLTEFGFVAAKHLHEGLNVIDASLFDAVGPNDDGDKACIADVFAAWAKTPGMLTNRMPLAPENLHGDGRSCDKEVHVVWPDRELRREVDADLSGSIEEVQFVASQLVSGEPLELDPSTKAQLLKAVAFAADGSMGRCREALAFLLGCLLHAKKHGAAAAAWRDASGLQSVVDCAAAAPELFRECLRAHPALKQFDDFLIRQDAAISVDAISNWLASVLQVASDGVASDAAEQLADSVARMPFPVQGNHFLDQIVIVRTSHVVGLPVYDVSTASTLYTVNQVISSNCRCAWMPAQVGETPVKKRNTSQPAVEQAIARAGGGTDWGPAVEIGPRPSLNTYMPALTDYALEQLSRLTQVRFPEAKPEPAAVVVESAPDLFS